MKKILTVFAIIAACSPLFSAQMDDIQVIKAVQSFRVARDNFDVNALTELTADNYVEVTPDGSWAGKKQVLASFAPEKKSPPPQNEGSTYNVRFFGDTGVVVSLLQYDVKTTDGNNHHFSSRVIYVLQRFKGEWKLISAQYTPVLGQGTN